MAFAICSVPPAIAVLPVNVLLALNTSVPLSDLTNPPGPANKPASVSVFPLVSKVALLPLIGKVIGTLVDHELPARKVPPVILNDALPEPLISPDPLKLNKPPLRLYVPIAPEN